MDTHDIHGTDVDFHRDAKETKDFLRQEDKHIVEGHLKDAKEHGKAHFEDADGKKFTIEHNKDNGSFLVRPRNI